MSQSNWVPTIGPATLLNQTPEEAAASRPNQFLSDAVDGVNNAALSATPKRFKAADIYGYKAVDDNGAPTNNTGTIWVGFTDGSGAKVVDPVGPGEYVIIKAPEFASLDLADVYIWGDTSGDKVFVRYN